MTDKEMLQVQHVQIAGGTNSAEDVCADTKKAVTIRLQDALTGALIGLARAIDDPETASAETWTIMTEGLMATAPDACISAAALETMIQSIRAEKARLAPGCSSCTCAAGRTR